MSEENTPSVMTSTETSSLTSVSENTLEQTCDQAETELNVSVAERIKHEAKIEEVLTQRVIKKILTTERERVCAILSVCNTMNRNDLATNLIEKGLTIEEASHKILNAMATEGEGSQVTTNLTPFPNTTDENPLIQNAKARAESTVV